MQTPENTKRNNHLSLSPDFIPGWIEDLTLVRESNPSTFVVYQTLKFYAVESPSFECDVTEGDIRNHTGLSFRTIRTALLTLIQLGKVSKIGYHRWQLTNFFKFKLSTTSVKNAEPEQNQSGNNCRTSSANFAPKFGKNCTEVRQELPNPLFNKRQRQRFKESENGDKSPILDEEKAPLLIRFPFREREGLKTHLMARGYNEHEASLFMESFYREYTGRKS